MVPSGACMARAEYPLLAHRAAQQTTRELTSPLGLMSTPAACLSGVCDFRGLAWKSVAAVISESDMKTTAIRGDGRMTPGGGREWPAIKTSPFSISFIVLIH